MNFHRLLIFFTIFFANGPVLNAKESFARLKRLAQSRVYVSDTRPYDAVQGIFLNVDPLYLHQPEACANSFANCNLHTYAENAPAHQIDPSGLVPYKSAVRSKRGIGPKPLHPGSRGRLSVRFGRPRPAAIAQRNNEAALMQIVRSINPFQLNMNCGSCAVALDESLAGRPLVAGSRGGVVQLGDMEQLYGRTFSATAPAEHMRTFMRLQAVGARFIVAAERDGAIGHFFNAVIRGNNRTAFADYLDGQTGGRARPADFTRFRILRTNFYR